MIFKNYTFNALLIKGKDSKRKGSSETIRKATFCSSSHLKNKEFEQFLLEKKLIRKEFQEWFCGFSEGDGSFMISNKRAFFVINQKHCRALRYIRKNLGFGSIKKYKTYYRYTVSSKKGIYALISIFNGNLLLSKTQKRFQSWLDLYNISQKGYPDILKFDFLQTGWLSGFIDAEGCFSVYSARDSRYRLGFRIRFIFTLVQKESVLSGSNIGLFHTVRSNNLFLVRNDCQTQFDTMFMKNERFVLEQIASALGSGAVRAISSSFPMNGIYRYSLWTKQTQMKLIRYLSNYPLRSTKTTSYKRWFQLLVLSTKPKWLETISRDRLFRKIVALQKVEDRVQP